MARKKDTPQKAALREMMGNYITTGIYPIKGRKPSADMDEEEGN